ncbi:hypothetical protein [Mycobacteroides chelonae]|uniref:Uncharacterized protein n=1 Tax=Mycobacteroides chelonae TaxID=1774 RepID=A0A1S1M2B3_MYCCH|nr:hypothetical protein [Mycobacteroides chelonae]OHU76045.1 hypothetical protein BKG84_24425 [Mycobacteroides chelonae]
MSTSRSRRTAGEPTTVAFNLPLPMDVVVTLTRAIGVLYPDALMDATGSRPNQITMQIPAVSVQDRSSQDPCGQGASGR